MLPRCQHMPGTCTGEMGPCCSHPRPSSSCRGFLGKHKTGQSRAAPGTTCKARGDPRPPHSRRQGVGPHKVATVPEPLAALQGPQSPLTNASWVKSCHLGAPQEPREMAALLGAWCKSHWRGSTSQHLIPTESLSCPGKGSGPQTAVQDAPCQPLPQRG